VSCADTTVGDTTPQASTNNGTTDASRAFVIDVTNEDATVTSVTDAASHRRSNRPGNGGRLRARADRHGALLDQPSEAGPVPRR
jgi:hypothetical protein